MPAPSRADARHEAAHAVVAVRCGLPLESTTIRRNSAPISPGGPKPPPGMKWESSGYTTLPSGTAEAWRDALPDPIAREHLQRFALQAAAGIVAELDRGAKDHANDGDDLQGVVQIAGILGIGTSSAEEPVREFMRDAIAGAGEVLLSDEGMAWDRVTTELFRKRSLRGDEVRAIVAESDQDRTR